MVFPLMKWQQTPEETVEVVFPVEGRIDEPDENDENLESLSITRLKELAKEKGIENYSKMSKAELLKALDDKI